jgi:hypothetical protein
VIGATGSAAHESGVVADESDAVRTQECAAIVTRFRTAVTFRFAIPGGKVR